MSLSESNLSSKRTPSFISLFPLWAIIFTGLALWQPALFASGRDLIVPLLGLVMFGMGMTLTWQNFRDVLARPSYLGLGLSLQYLIMPLAALAVGLALNLPPALIAGMVLVGASPGGTASNVVSYLAKGDVALSITLTTASTLVAVIATPLLTLILVGERVPVPVLGMLQSIFQMVILPVALGVTINQFFGARLQPIKPLFPLISVVAIVAIIAIIVGLNSDNIAQMGALVALAVVLHNALGLGGGYAAGWWLTRDHKIARTLAIEVGMQNSGLAVALAVKHFSVAAALPGALFSIWHNISGSLLAAIWSRRQ
ncbi:bile acid:Na+ symporter, BASS family [Ectothiorhodosinus mongolicus]|uniref:Bile acid:Na+ symporter, BASS family n=1 Tax=Ectothiorhodosinus mongolicus TaxID=233100 RepID=A0A1R3VM88_9GAMM|nr:bile acid:sodium symporter family protein [Ectothiorhodosinus mongolicus]ULX57836.1 bile acid:sodium symporter [Ectothiorhodosinus mongolicus]SIT65708.1 bile acid:Na+ symporter, BASS family [Ectothiorhodosinus mongolicus]